MAIPGLAQLLTFSVENDEYALDILRVREIARQQSVRPIPGAPPALVGVIHLRQTEVIPVLDLRRRFGLSPLPPDQPGRIIVAVVDGRLVGLLVDAVLDVIPVERGNISGGASVFHGAAGGYISGVCHHRGRLLVLLNLRRLLSSEDRVVIDAVREQTRDGGAREEA